MGIPPAPGSGTIGVVVLLVALALIVAEYLFARSWQEHAYDVGETAASLVISIGHRITALAAAPLVAIPAAWVYQHRLFDIPLRAWSLPALFLGVEVCYYWQHVAMHKVTWFWATHAVHHSATRLNLSAALRLGWGGILTGGFLFFLPLIWIGFPPYAIFAAVGLGLVYQFFLHSTWAPRLGWLEWILNTPSHHHVHHASNQACLDRNFGSMLIIFDRLFGTFAEAPRDEPLRFGIKGAGAPTRSPLRVVFAGWLEMAHSLRIAGTWRQRWAALFGQPAAIVAFLLMATVVPTAASAGDVEWKIQIGGRERNYTVHLPAQGMDGRPVPLVVVLHGGAGSGSSAARQTHFSDAADAAGFIVVYPDGTDRPRPFWNAMGKPGFLTWNAGGCCGYAMQNGVDDVGFARAMVAQLEQNYPIDRRRIYATGISNGGMMAYRLACEASDIFAAVGVVSGVVVAQPCAPRRPVSVIHIHGTADQYVLIDGGIGAKSLTRTSYPPAHDSIALWAGVDGCRRQAQGSPAAGVQSFDYRDCRAGTEVVYDIIEGGGHAWPGGERMLAMLDQPSTALRATAVIWAFFAGHPKS